MCIYACTVPQVEMEGRPYSMGIIFDLVQDLWEVKYSTVPLIHTPIF